MSLPSKYCQKITRRSIVVAPTHHSPVPLLVTMYKSVRQAMSSRPYIASVLFNIFINFVLNYGLQ